MPHRRAIQAGEIRARRDRVAEMTRNGLTAPQIAEELRVTERTVVRDRVELGCAQPPRPKLTEDELRIAAEMLDDGCPYTEVAQTLGRSTTTMAARFPGKGLTHAEMGMYNAARRRLALL
jgi:DNA-binding NarL/FixJ family response regulator